MECPRCNSDSIPTGKEWKYNVFNVTSYYCSKCGKKFNAYCRNDARGLTRARVLNNKFG